MKSIYTVKRWIWFKNKYIFIGLRKNHLHFTVILSYLNADYNNIFVWKVCVVTQFLLNIIKRLILLCYKTFMQFVSTVSSLFSTYHDILMLKSLHASNYFTFKSYSKTILISLVQH